jgi:hypothetical protein
MMRTLETAAGVFGLAANSGSGGSSSMNGGASGGGLSRGGGGGSSSSLASNGGLPRHHCQQQQQGAEQQGELQQLMLEQREEEGGARIAHAAVVARPGIKFVAHELCRERLGGWVGRGERKAKGLLCLGTGGWKSIWWRADGPDREGVL